MTQKIALQNVQRTCSLIFKILNAHYYDFPLYLLFSRIPFACRLPGRLVLRPASGLEVETEETFKRFSLLKTNKTSLGWSGEELGWLQQGERKRALVL